jgi:transducin (beta)-like 1
MAEDGGVKTPASSSSRRRKQIGADDNENLSVPTTKSRTKSPSGKKGSGKDTLKSPSKRSQDNPLSFQESDIGLFVEHRDIINDLAWNSKNTDRLASASNDSTARFWDLTPSTEDGSRALELSSSNGKSVVLNHKSIESNKKAISALSWHPEGTFLATAAGDGVGRMFTPNGALEGIMAYGRGGVNAIKFSPNGCHVLLATVGRAVNLFNVTAGPSMRSSFDSHTGESGSFCTVIQSKRPREQIMLTVL